MIQSFNYNNGRKVHISFKRFHVALRSLKPNGRFSIADVLEYAIPRKRARHKVQELPLAVAQEIFAGYEEWLDRLVKNA